MSIFNIKGKAELSQEKFKKALQWWSCGIQKEEFTISETPESLERSLLDGAFVYFGEQIVGASGIFPARTKNGEEIFFEGKLVVELGSNYVDPMYRNNGLGKRMLIHRIDSAVSKKWFPVSVTTNPIMKKIFLDIGAQAMDPFEEFTEMRKKLCICKVISPDCKSCPLHENASWFFRR